MRLRNASAEDAPALLDLWLAADAEPTHTDDVESLHKLIAHDPAALIVADDGGRLAGSVIAAWDGWRGSVYRLVVAPSHRRHGLGRALLAAAEERFAAAGAVRSQAFTVSSDPQAVGFWRASGWKEQVERTRFVRG